VAGSACTVKLYPNPYPIRAPYPPVSYTYLWEERLRGLVGRLLLVEPLVARERHRRGRSGIRHLHQLAVPAGAEARVVVADLRPPPRVRECG
jgi:hypothetical protein